MAAKLDKILTLTLVMALVPVVMCGKEREKDIGQIEYQTKCAACHGVDAKGNGPVASRLKTQPADLTLLAKKNGGQFPLESVYESIDGRRVVKSHGSREMPVWGYQYKPFPKEALSSKPIENLEPKDFTDPEAVIKSRILLLVSYLSRIQEK